MIRVSRLNGKEYIINCELIKFIEATPDTVITLTSGEKIMVRENTDQIVQSTMNYKKKLHQEPPTKEGS
jgi:flagellar protein FlbD